MEGIRPKRSTVSSLTLVGEMTAEERLTELAQILSAGLLRLMLKSTPKSADFRESSLDILPTRSVDPEGLTSETD